MQNAQKYANNYLYTTYQKEKNSKKAWTISVYVISPKELKKAVK